MVSTARMLRAAAMTWHEVDAADEAAARLDAVAVSWVGVVPRRQLDDTPTELEVAAIGGEEVGERLAAVPTLPLHSRRRRSESVLLALSAVAMMLRWLLLRLLLRE